VTIGNDPPRREPNATLIDRDARKMARIATILAALATVLAIVALILALTHDHEAEPTSTTSTNQTSTLLAE
jgi:hypothetical protein